MRVPMSFYHYETNHYYSQTNQIELTKRSITQKNEAYV